MKLICDKCGEVFDSGLFNILEHQFEKCKAHKIEKASFGDFYIKTMPKITPKVKEDDKS